MSLALTQLIGFGARRAAAGGGYRYLALQLTSSSDATYARIREIEWGVGGTYHPATKMTSATAPSPQKVYRSSELTYVAWKAYDGVSDTGSSSSHWLVADTSPRVIIIDFGSGNLILPSTVRMKPYGDSPNTENWLAFSAYGSNDTAIETIANWSTASKTLLGSFSPGDASGTWTNNTWKEFTF